MRVLLSRLVSKRWPSGALSKRCISQPHGCSLLVAWFCQLYRVLVVVVVVVTTAGLALTACSAFRAARASTGRAIGDAAVAQSYLERIGDRSGEKVEQEKRKASEGFTCKFR
uniref:Uncharacterized protein n=1 Tax=Oryza glumipatula TaxID=40148 RepID=A0A0D9Z0L0_9ORYZ